MLNFCPLAMLLSGVHKVTDYAQNYAHNYFTYVTVHIQFVIWHEKREAYVHIKFNYFLKLEMS